MPTTWLRNLPVQKKLGFAMLVTSLVALLVACAVFVGLEHVDYKRNLTETVNTLGRITAENCTAALAFSDQRTAEQTLETLLAEPQIVGAILYDTNGNVFARFSPKPDQLLQKVSNAAGVRVEDGYVIGVQPVMEGSRLLGTLYLQASMDTLYQRFRRSAMIAAGILTLSIALAWQIASILRLTLAQPILELVQTADAVSVYQDFGRRARQFGNDELGRLTVAFNAMLERTQNAVRALRESEWTHRELVRALPIAAYMCDVRGKITLYNDAALNLWGRAPEVGIESIDQVMKISRVDGSPLPNKATTVADPAHPGNLPEGEEILIERPDGTRRSVMPYPRVMRNTNGQVVGHVTMLLDITDQKKADADARRLAAIVASSDDAIIGKDLNGIITSWNHGAQVLFGYTAEEMVGQSIMTLIPQGKEPEEQNILGRLKHNEFTKYEETVRRRKDGSLIHVSITVSPVHDRQGRIVGGSKIAHDITARKHAERQANFVYELSHRLSTVTDPDETIRVISREVGLHMGVDRCFFCLLDPTGTQSVVKEDWAREGFRSITGIHRSVDFGTPELWRQLSTGPHAVNDTAENPIILNHGPGYGALKIASHLSVPFIRNDKWIATLAVACGKPRIWKREETEFLENVLARVWPMVERAISQRELQESERRQRELMQALPVPCYTMDRQGRLSFFNDAAEQLWEKKPSLGDSDWFTLLSSHETPLSFEDSPAGIAMIERHPVRGVEGVVLRPDGSKRWVILHSDPIFEQPGECSGVVNVVLDVTAERTAQLKVRKTAEHLSLAIASAKLGDWSWDPVSDRLTLSKRTAEIFGVPHATDLKRAQMKHLIHKDDQPRSEAAMARALKNHSDYDIEYRITWSDDTVHWVAAKGRPIFGKDGEVQAMVGVVQDITERKEQAQKLSDLANEIEEQARLFDAILSNLTDHAYAFGPDGRYIFANRPLLEALHSRMEEVVGKNALELGFPVELAQQIQNQIRTVIEKRQAVRGETVITAANGKVDDYEYIYNPVLSDDGEVTAVVGSSRLITGRKQAENELKRARDEALAASRAKDDFLAALSHELRTPLNPVLLLASDAATNPEIPAAVRRDFEFIRKNVDLEARLIDDLLDITRITRGKLPIDQRNCRLHGILKDALANVQADMREKKIELRADFKASKSTVWGDAVRLQQIFWNILKNAVKFTPPEGTILLTTENVDSKVVVTITDTGIGMTPDEIARIFRAFSQGEHAAPGTGSHRFGGLGLGLAISKMLAELHHGKIEAYSEGRGTGSRFVVELPLHEIAGDEQHSPTLSRRVQTISPFPGAAEARKTACAGRKILLVEDHAPTRQTLQHLLKSRHFEVVAAKTAGEGLKFARESEFSLIISDVGLPDKSGFELMKEIQSFKPALPGIALSGYGMEDDLARSQEAGFSVHLVKPIAIGILEEAINNLLPPTPPALSLNERGGSQPG
ncbi:MAG: PAS domain S-box protein [Nibricoccus sp.]